MKFRTLIDSNAKSSIIEYLFPVNIPPICVNPTAELLLIGLESELDHISFLEIN